MFLSQVYIFCYWLRLAADVIFAMKLGDSVMKSFCVAKVFRENSERINSIDFAPNGENLISASDDDSIVIFDCANEGKYVIGI